MQYTSLPQNCKSDESSIVSSRRKLMPAIALGAFHGGEAGLQIEGGGDIKGSIRRPSRFCHIAILAKLL
jgi:hypothetical protein